MTKRQASTRESKRVSTAGSTPESTDRSESSFGFRPDARFAVGVDFDVNHTGSTADGAVFGVLLRGSFRQIDRDDDLLAARVANVAGFVMHDVAKANEILRMAVGCLAKDSIDDRAWPIECRRG